MYHYIYDSYIQCSYMSACISEQPHNIIYEQALHRSDYVDVKFISGYMYMHADRIRRLPIYLSYSLKSKDLQGEMFSYS